MNSMEESFQSDVVGYLEFVSRVHDDKPDQHTSVLLESLQTTLVYYNNTEEAKHQLHKVLFRAWKERESYNVDFDIPSFKRGIQPFEFLYIVMALNMEQLTLIQLSSIPPESSALAIQELLTFNNIADFTNDLLISLFKLMPGIELEDTYNNTKSFAMEYLLNYGIEQNTLYIIICKLSDSLDYYNRQLTFAKQKLNNSLSDVSSVWKEIDKVTDLIINLITITYKERTTFIDKKLLNIVKKLQSIESKVQEHVKNNDNNNLSSLYQLVEQHHLNKPFSQHNNYHQIHTRTKEDNRNTMILDWRNTIAYCTSKQDFHQQAFITICLHLKMNIFPFQPVDISDILYQNNNTEKQCMESFEKLSQSIINKRQFSALTESQLWCISILSNKNGLWKSVLKVIVQFMDLWIGLIQESNTEDIFALLITNQNMLSTLYQNILKHVRHYNKYRKPVIFNMIKSICLLLERCLDMSSVGKIQTLRNEAFFNGYSEKDKTLPVLGTVDFWNISFDIEITKIGNQITTLDDMEYSLKMNDVLIRKINTLSLIWPYKVVQELLLLCVYNKNQYKVIVPILRQLGGLCQLKNKICSDSLLLVVLKDILRSRDRVTIEEHMGSITQFVKECCHIEFSYPIIMAPYLLAEFSSKVLLDIREFLQDCILKNLECFYTLTTTTSDEDQYDLNMSIFRTSLTLLHSLFNSVKEKGESWLSLVQYEQKYGLPIILYSQPETMAKYLTNMLYLRSGTRQKVPRGFRLQDWETALTLVRTLSDIVKYTFQPSNEFTKFIKFLESLENYDWKMQILWYDLSSHLPELKHPILVPDSLFRLTGEMNDLFVSDQATQNDPLIGWINLFDACKLSETLIDTLFINHEKWMYNLILLWKHPNEDDIIGPCFRQVLHPKYNFSVTSEYPILLFDFLERLSGTFDVQTVVYDYSQSDPELLKVIKKLSEQGIKQFFQVLYIIRLLKEEAEYCKGKELEMESTYYISSLIKSLQGLTNWGSLSKTNFFKSQPAYRVIKAAILPDNTCINSTVPTFESNPLILEDNVHSGITIATGQSEFATHTYYPLFDKETISCRALSMLTLCFLCQICGQSESIETRDIIRRLIFQIVEGFIDVESKRYFQSMIKKQPKNRIASWKKAKRPKVAMILRPIISEDEEKLLISYLESLNDSEKNGILQALNLTLSLESHKKEYSGSKVLYFV